MAEKFLSFSEIQVELDKQEAKVGDDALKRAIRSDLVPSEAMKKVIENESLTVGQRRVILSSIAKDTALNRQFHTNDRMVAIDILNKMDKLYREKEEEEHPVVHTFVFVLPDGTKFTPGLLTDGDRSS